MAHMGVGAVVWGGVGTIHTALIVIACEMKGAFRTTLSGSYGLVSLSALADQRQLTKPSSDLAHRVENINSTLHSPSKAVTELSRTITP